MKISVMLLIAAILCQTVSKKCKKGCSPTSNVGNSGYSGRFGGDNQIQVIGRLNKPQMRQLNGILQSIPSQELQNSRVIVDATKGRQTNFLYGHSTSARGQSSDNVEANGQNIIMINMARGRVRSIGKAGGGLAVAAEGGHAIGRGGKITLLNFGRGSVEAQIHGGVGHATGGSSGGLRGGDGLGMGGNAEVIDYGRGASSTRAIGGQGFGYGGSSNTIAGRGFAYGGHGKTNKN